LLKTIESVVAQTFTDFEYIIIDGGSTDGSVEIMKQNADKITYWVSEPDKGIYNAMNKGILRAKGEYCLFLNSGDWLVDENVLFDFDKMKFTENIVCGNIYFCKKEEIPVLFEPIKEQKLDFTHFYQNCYFPHQATFIEKYLFDKIGLYDESYQIIADWEFLLKALIVCHCSYKYFDRNIAYYDTSGISFQEINTLKIQQDKERAYQKHIPHLVYDSYKKLYSETYLYKNAYEEYMNLKNGDFGFIIKLLLFFKNKKMKFFK
jgi:glycosyltransferase involved in cell wall biosynthesis